MAKVNKQRTQKPEATGQTPKGGEALAPIPTRSASGAAPQSSSPTAKAPGKGKQGKKDARPRIGGTAVPGAKTTQPRQIDTSDPAQQQMASYNHEMRRRMQHMGVGPSKSADVQNKRRKKLEKRKQRLEERKQEVKKVTAGAPTRIVLGRRNIYFIIGVALIIVAFIVIAILVNHFK